MTQWDRRYRVLVHSRAGGRALDVSQLRCKFEIYKNLDEEPNYSVVTIYNLSGASEKSILENGASVTVEAGYENAAFGLIFSGEIIQWARGREDGTDKYLRLVCQDGDHLLTSAFVATTLARGAGQEDIVAACLSGASAGRLDLAPGSLPRAKTLFGMNRDYLHQAAVTAGGKLYVENGVANIVSASFAGAALCADLRPDTGLIGTPEQTDYGVSAKCLLNPCLKLNARVRIDSEYVVPQEARRGTELSALPTDGVYRISRINYRGDTRGEEWYCEIEAENAAATESRDDETGDKIHCALPGVIEAFDENEQTVSVRLAVREKVRDETGEGYTEKEIPVLQNVPIFFPRAGGWSLLFPIQKGDECLVVFCDRCIDGWWQSGGVQSQAESRSHDYSDGIALIGPWSQPRRIKAKWPKNGARLTKDSGGCYIEVGSGTVTIAGDCVITGSLTAGKGGSEGKPGSAHKFYGDVFTAQTKETKLQSETGVEIETAAFKINDKEFQDHAHAGANAPVEKWY